MLTWLKSLPHHQQRLTPMHTLPLSHLWRVKLAAS
jgi:hypothetical protein